MLEKKKVFEMFLSAVLKCLKVRRQVEKYLDKKKLKLIEKSNQIKIQTKKSIRIEKHFFPLKKKKEEKRN